MLSKLSVSDQISICEETIRSLELDNTHPTVGICRKLMTNLVYHYAAIIGHSDIEDLIKNDAALWPYDLRHPNSIWHEIYCIAKQTDEFIPNSPYFFHLTQKGTAARIAILQVFINYLKAKLNT